MNWVDELPTVDRKALEELRFIKPKMKVHRHRCHHCGVATKHVFCKACCRLPKRERAVHYTTDR